LQAAEKDAADASTKRSHDEGAASLNASQVLMLHSRLKIIQARAAQANKAALEASHYEMVVMYLAAAEVIRPPAPPDVSVCKDVVASIHQHVNEKIWKNMEKYDKIRINTTTSCHAFLFCF
jgi:hypothetical protein